jgi:hypothetical protein
VIPIKAVTMPSLLGAIAAALTFFGGLHITVPTVASQAEPPRNDVPNAASCSEQCNRKASDCLDGCEERFKDDDKGRVTCKFECANKRQQCEKNCN